jgi:hypothetical protein
MVKNSIGYDLVASECKSDGAEGALVYGIQICRNVKYYIQIDDISSNRAEVDFLLEKVKIGEVPPDQLQYIVEDFLA